MHRTTGNRLAACGFVVVAALCFGAGSASGQVTTQSQLNVKLLLQRSNTACSVTMSDADFGALSAGANIAAGAVTTTFDVDFVCSTAVAAATASFDGGLNPAGGLRQVSTSLQNGIPYILGDAATQTPINIGDKLTFPLQSGSSTLTLDGALVAQRLPSIVGAYADVVTVTLTF